MIRVFLSAFALLALFFLNSCSKDDDSPLEESDLELFINEIHPTGGPDWLEIYNAGFQRVDLGGFLIYDDPENKYLIPSGISIEPGGFSIFLCDDLAFENHTNFKLSSRGETITLESNINELVDVVTYPELVEGSVYARFSDGSDHWAISSNPTQGASNGSSPSVVINSVSQTPIVVEPADDVIIEVSLSSSSVTSINLNYQINNGNFTTIPMSAGSGALYQATIPALNASGEVAYYIEVVDSESFVVRSPVAAEAYYQYTTSTDELPQLYINEFLAVNQSCCPDTDGGTEEFDDWIEIYNAGSASVDIGGFYITDDSADPFKYQIPTDAQSSTTIPSGGYLILWADNDTEQGPLHLGFGLSGEGEDISLNYRDGRTIDLHSFGVQTADISQGRIQDGSETWTSFSNPTPGQSNN